MIFGYVHDNDVHDVDEDVYHDAYDDDVIDVLDNVNDNFRLLCGDGKSNHHGSYTIR